MTASCSRAQSAERKQMYLEYVARWNLDGNYYETNKLYLGGHIWLLFMVFFWRLENAKHPLCSSYQIRRLQKPMLINYMRILFSTIAEI